MIPTKQYKQEHQYKLLKAAYVLAYALVYMPFPDGIKSMLYSFRLRGHKMATGSGNKWADTTTDHELDHCSVAFQRQQRRNYARLLPNTPLCIKDLPLTAAISSAVSPLLFLAFTSQGADPGGPLALAACASSRAMHCNTYSVTSAWPLSAAPCKMVFPSSVKQTTVLPH